MSHAAFPNESRGDKRFSLKRTSPQQTASTKYPWGYPPTRTPCTTVINYARPPEPLPRSDPTGEDTVGDHLVGMVPTGQIPELSLTIDINNIFKIPPSPPSPESGSVPTWWGWGASDCLECTQQWSVPLRRVHLRGRVASIKHTSQLDADPFTSFYYVARGNWRFSAAAATGEHAPANHGHNVDPAAARESHLR